MRYTSMQDCISKGFNVLSFWFAGENEEACDARIPGGDYTIWSVLHSAAGEANLSQLGQGNSTAGSHLQHVQGTNLFLHLFRHQWCSFVALKMCVCIYDVKQGRVCGLCGNFDGNVNNDLMSSNNQLEVDFSHFGNSWKVVPSCADVTQVSPGLTLKDFH